jgi:LysM repeat protein/predicted nucleic acid-binding Zn ribbon protein
MNERRISPAPDVHRCPNCGTRVAQNAETCYFCGYDLANQPKQRRRITWVDLLVVLGLLFVVFAWWQLGSRPDNELAAQGEANTTFEIEIPTAEPVATATPAPPTPTVEPPTPMPINTPVIVKHVVHTGETLLGIAQFYDVSVEDIQAANNLPNELIRVGDELIIPIPQAAAEGANENAVPSVFNYTVLPGDTVVSLAIRFGTTVEAILKANNMGPNDFIRPNQKLIIPVEEVPAAVLASSNTAPAPSASSSNRQLFEAPRLIGPRDGDTMFRTNDITLRWVSVDILAPNEWYVVRAWPTQGTLPTPPAIWTKATSYRLSKDWAPPPGTSARFGWQVVVVRVLPDKGAGREIQAASQPSEVRTFTWR